MASSIRRSDQPRRPSARTCCRFSAVKTLLMPGRNVPFPTGVNVSGRYPKWPVFKCPSMAGFGCPPRPIASLHQRGRPATAPDDHRREREEVHAALRLLHRGCVSGGLLMRVLVEGPRAGAGCSYPDYTSNRTADRYRAAPPRRRPWTWTATGSGSVPRRRSNDDDEADRNRWRESSAPTGEPRGAGTDHGRPAVELGKPHRRSGRPHGGDTLMRSALTVRSGLSRVLASRFFRVRLFRDDARPLAGSAFALGWRFVGSAVGQGGFSLRFMLRHCPHACFKLHTATVLLVTAYAEDGLVPV